MSDNTPQEADIDATFAELAEAEVFFTDECRKARQEDNLPRVQDLTNHILRVSKERITLAEKRGRLITLGEAKEAYNKANDYFLAALWEVCPDDAADVVELAAKLREHDKSDDLFGF